MIKRIWVCCARWALYGCLKYRRASCRWSGACKVVHCMTDNSTTLQTVRIALVSRHPTVSPVTHFQLRSSSNKDIYKPFKVVFSPQLQHLERRKEQSFVRNTEAKKGNGLRLQTLSRGPPDLQRFDALMLQRVTIRRKKYTSQNLSWGELRKHPCDRARAAFNSLG